MVEFTWVAPGLVTHFWGDVEFRWLDPLAQNAPVQMEDFSFQVVSATNLQRYREIHRTTEPWMAPSLSPPLAIAVLVCRVFRRLRRDAVFFIDNLLRFRPVIAVLAIGLAALFPETMCQGADAVFASVHGLLLRLALCRVPQLQELRESLRILVDVDAHEVHRFQPKRWRQAAASRRVEALPWIQSAVVMQRDRMPEVGSSAAW